MNSLVRAVSSGSVAENDVVAWSIGRNFASTAAAWLDHHRRLGITKFVILDDRSSDTSRQLLLDQKDCIVLESDRRYGEMEGRKQIRRQLKNEMIDMFFRGHWALHLDTDEYLALPARYPGVTSLIAKAEAQGIENIAAVMIDFYPSDPALLFAPAPMPYDPFSDCRYFDRGPYVLWTGDIIPHQVHGGIRETLLRRYGLVQRHATNSVDLESSKPRQTLGDGPRIFSLLDPSSTDLPLFNSVRRELNSGTHLRSAPWLFKTPLVKWTGNKAFGHDHYLDEPADSRLCLGLIHFKLCRGFFDYAAEAIENKQHDRNALAYSYYSKLAGHLKEMPTLVHRKSVAYAGAADLENAQLIYDHL
jgi:hypothetical protein